LNRWVVCLDQGVEDSFAPFVLYHHSIVRKVDLTACNLPARKFSIISSLVSLKH
jgi:hypothetical protein